MAIALPPYRTLGQHLTDLKRITAGCSDDMHEPNVGARVAGKRLDNAALDGEILVRLVNEEGYGETFYLADLIALARLARPEDVKKVQR